MAESQKKIACYIRHSILPVEEDLTHEFKAHRDLSKLDYSEMKVTPARNGGFTEKVKRYRLPLSNTICGMLNTGLDCTLYLGITDEGAVEGFMMSLYQKDHFELSLRDLLNNYFPPVPEHFISVNFVPIVDPGETGVSPEPIGLDTPRWLEHFVRDTRYCWCDNYTLAACSHGILHRFYVIEVSFHAWNQDDPKNAKIIRKDVIHGRPIFANECGEIYIRRNGHNLKAEKKDLEVLKKSSLKVTNENLLDAKADDDSDTTSDEYFSYETDSELD